MRINLNTLDTIIKSAKYYIKRDENIDFNVEDRNVDIDIQINSKDGFPDIYRIEFHDEHQNPYNVFVFMDENGNIIKRKSLTR